MVVWRRERPSMRGWAVLRRSKEGDLLAFLSEDGKEIEIVELLMQVYAAPQSSNEGFGNFQMPAIGIAVILVIGYQYMKQKNSTMSASSLGSAGKKPAFDAEAFMRNRKGGGDTFARKKFD